MDEKHAQLLDNMPEVLKEILQRSELVGDLQRICEAQHANENLAGDIEHLLKNKITTWLDAKFAITNSKLSGHFEDIRETLVKEIKQLVQPNVATIPAKEVKNTPSKKTKSSSTSKAIKELQQVTTSMDERQETSHNELRQMNLELSAAMNVGFNTIQSLLRKEDVKKENPPANSGSDHITEALVKAFSKAMKQIDDQLQKELEFLLQRAYGVCMAEKESRTEVLDIFCRRAKEYRTNRRLMLNYEFSKAQKAFHHEVEISLEEADVLFLKDFHGQSQRLMEELRQGLLELTPEAPRTNVLAQPAAPRTPTTEYSWWHTFTESIHTLYKTVVVFLTLLFIAWFVMSSMFRRVPYITRNIISRTRFHS